MFGEHIFSSDDSHLKEKFHIEYFVVNMSKTMTEDKQVFSRLLLQASDRNLSYMEVKSL